MHAIKLFLVAYGLSFTVANTQANTPSPLPVKTEVTHKNSNLFRDALLPVPKTAIFKMEGYALWDPSVIKVDDTYHLFASRWPKANDHSFSSGWMQSHVIRATSPSLFGPYTFQEVVLDPKHHPWATKGIHNPKITKAGDKFLLYHLGIPKWQTGFAFADNIEGPWKPVPEPIVKANNPALLIHKDKSAYLVSKFKPNKNETKDGRWDAYMRVHQANDIHSPFKITGGKGNRLPNDFELEDPSIWWANNQYNLICTDWEGKATGINKSVLYYTSTDGINYQLYSNIPIWSQNDVIPVIGGDDLTVARVERPQVYANDKGEVEALLVAVGIEERGHDFIVIRPVNNFFPSKP